MTALVKVFGLQLFPGIALYGNSFGVPLEQYCPGENARNAGNGAEKKDLVKAGHCAGYFIKRIRQEGIQYDSAHGCAYRHARRPYGIVQAANHASFAFFHRRKHGIKSRNGTHSQPHSIKGEEKTYSLVACVRTDLGKKKERYGAECHSQRNGISKTDLVGHPSSYR